MYEHFLLCVIINDGVFSMCSIWASFYQIYDAIRCARRISFVRRNSMQ